MATQPTFLAYIAVVLVFVSVLICWASPSYGESQAQREGKYRMSEHNSAASVQHQNCLRTAHLSLLRLHVRTCIRTPA